ncbi:MAG: WD40 repeat domain-containing protein, partial [Planctomycetota bacterium]
AVSADGSRAMIADMPGTPILVETATGREISRFGEDARRMVLAADGSFAIVATANTLETWSLDELPVVQASVNSRCADIALEEGAAGRLAVIRDGGVVTLLNALSLRELDSIRIDNARYLAWAKLNEGSCLVVAASSPARIEVLSIDGDAITPKRTLTPPRELTGCTGIAARGDLLVAGFALPRWGGLTAWRLSDPQPLFVRESEDVRLTDLAVAGDRIYAGTWDHAIDVYDVVTGRRTNRLMGHASSPQYVDTSRDGRWLISGSLDGTVRLWRIDRQPNHRPRLRTNSAALSLDVSDGIHGPIAVVAEFEGRIRLLDVEAAEWRDSPPDPPGRGITMATLVGTDGRLGATRADGWVGIFHPAENAWHEVRPSAFDEPRPAWAARINADRDGRFVVFAGDSDSVPVFDTTTGQETALAAPGFGTIYGVAISENGELVAAGGRSGNVAVWKSGPGSDWSRAETLWQDQGSEGYIMAIDLSPDGRLLAFAETPAGTAVELREARTGKQRWRGEAHLGSVHDVTFSPDATRLASVSNDSSLLLWDIASGDVVLRLEREHEQYAWAAAFDPSGDRLLTTSHDESVLVRVAAPAP